MEAATCLHPSFEPSKRSTSGLFDAGAMAPCGKRFPLVENRPPGVAFSFAERTLGHKRVSSRAMTKPSHRKHRHALQVDDTEDASALLLKLFLHSFVSWAKPDVSSCYYRFMTLAISKICIHLCSSQPQKPCQKHLCRIVHSMLTGLKNLFLVLSRVLDPCVCWCSCYACTSC